MRVTFRLRLTVLASLVVGWAHPAAAQLPPTGFSITSSQGGGSISSAINVVQANLTQQTQLQNVQQVGSDAQGNLYRITDPQAEFRVVQDTGSTQTIRREQRQIYSTFQESGISVFQQ